MTERQHSASYQAQDTFFKKKFSLFAFKSSRKHYFFFKKKQTFHFFMKKCFTKKNCMKKAEKELSGAKNY